MLCVFSLCAFILSTMSVCCRNICVYSHGKHTHCIYRLTHKLLSVCMYMFGNMANDLLLLYVHVQANTCVYLDYECMFFVNVGPNVSVTLMVLNACTQSLHRSQNM